MAGTSGKSGGGEALENFQWEREDKLQNKHSVSCGIRKLTSSKLNLYPAVINELEAEVCKRGRIANPGPSYPYYGFGLAAAITNTGPLVILTTVANRTIISMPFSLSLTLTSSLLTISALANSILSIPGLLLKLSKFS